MRAADRPRDRRCIYLGVSVPVIGIGAVAVATTLFTAITAFAAVTGGGALILAAWHLRNRGEAARQIAPDQGLPAAARRLALDNHRYPA